MYTSQKDINDIAAYFRNVFTKFNFSLQLYFSSIVPNLNTQSA